MRENTDKKNPKYRHFSRSDFVSPDIQLTQPAITCSKLTIETLEQSVKYVRRAPTGCLLLTAT